MRRDSSRSAAALRLVFWVGLLAGLALRAGTFRLPHQEGDERIYAALVEQLLAGKGYTLAGHPIVQEPWLVREQYDTPLFYHPPCGIVWMALFGAAFPGSGLDVAQLAAFALFYAGVWKLARETLPAFPARAAMAVAALGATTPIVAHVSMHRWLDGPQVAAAVWAAWGCARALRTGRILVAIGAGLLVGAALLVRLNTALALPGIAALAWAVALERPARERARLLGVVLGVSALCVLPWLIAELRAYGTPFPSWAGKPAARLVEENPFIRQVTVVRTPFAYFRLLPLVVASLVPSAIVLARPRGSAAARAIAAALAVWIGVVVLAHVALGAIGYSKLLRYVVLVQPATVLLAGLAAESLGEKTRRFLGALLLAGIALEAAQGIQTVIQYPDRAWIRPLVGPAE